MDHRVSSGDALQPDERKIRTDALQNSAARQYLYYAAHCLIERIHGAADPTLMCLLCVYQQGDVQQVCGAACLI